MQLEYILPFGYIPQEQSQVTLYDNEKVFHCRKEPFIWDNDNNNNNNNNSNNCNNSFIIKLIESIILLISLNYNLTWLYIEKIYKLPAELSLEVERTLKLGYILK